MQESEKTPAIRRYLGFSPLLGSTGRGNHGEISTGRLPVGLQKKVTLSDGETIALWSPADALVIKVLTSIVHARLQPALNRTCYHLKGHGGLKGAVREVIKVLPCYRFFCKTDVRSYYDSIDHYTLLLQLHEHIRDRTIIGYMRQFLNRCVEWGGLYQNFRRGIPRVASLSPLLGAFYLLCKAIAELERLQRFRKGQPVPPP
jgi:hypothetical protein